MDQKSENEPRMDTDETRMQKELSFLIRENPCSSVAKLIPAHALKAFQFMT
jgi:hypothetical protein